MRHSHALMLSATLAVAAMPGLALARPAPAQTGTPTKARIEQQLQSGGYTKVHDLKFDDGKPAYGQVRVMKPAGAANCAASAAQTSDYQLLNKGTNCSIIYLMD